MITGCSISKQQALSTDGARIFNSNPAVHFKSIWIVVKRKDSGKEIAASMLQFANSRGCVSNYKGRWVALGQAGLDVHDHQGVWANINYASLCLEKSVLNASATVVNHHANHPHGHSLCPRLRRGLEVNKVCVQYECARVSSSHIPSHNLFTQSGT